MATTRARLVAASAIAGAALLMPASAAFGQTYGGGSEVPEPPKVESATVSKPLTTDPGSASSSGGTLPFTGGDIASLTVIAAAALGTGVVLTRSGRSRATA